jgi:hypothetical protein
VQTSIIIARLIGPPFATIGVGMLTNPDTYRQIGQQFLSTYRYAPSAPEITP